jgi:hypothetical protein
MPTLSIRTVTQLEQAGTAAGALWAVPAPLLRAADFVERSLSTGSHGRFSAIGRYLYPQLRNSHLYRASRTKEAHSIFSINRK